MPSSSLRIPKYRHHKARNLARVNINGKDIYLGEYDSPESHQKYDRLIAEWLLHQHVTPGDATKTLSICELMVCYLQYAESYYVKNGEVTTEFGCIRAALRPLRRLYESLPVTEFGPKALKQCMIQEKASRTYINSQIKRVQRMFKWGVSEEFVPAVVYQALATVGGLRKGRTEAVEHPPVLPVADAVIAQTLPHLPPVIDDMVRLQRLCGARPDEITRFRPIDIDKTGDVWVVRLASHKNEHHQKERSILLGPKAQLLLAPYLARDETSFRFSPRESESQRLKERHANRVTPLNQGCRPKKTTRILIVTENATPVGCHSMN